MNPDAWLPISTFERNVTFPLARPYQIQWGCVWTHHETLWWIAHLRHHRSEILRRTCWHLAQLPNTRGHTATQQVLGDSGKRRAVWLGLERPEWTYDLEVVGEREQKMLLLFRCEPGQVLPESQQLEDDHPRSRDATVGIQVPKNTEPSPNFDHFFSTQLQQPQQGLYCLDHGKCSTTQNGNLEIKVFSEAERPVELPHFMNVF